jgi:hypothetical protein
VAIQVLDNWYGEIKLYDFSRPGASFNAGHFTQVIWRASTQLGCGIEVLNGNMFFAVCQYLDRGNMHHLNKKAEDYEKNVPSLLQSG